MSGAIAPPLAARAVVARVARVAHTAATLMHARASWPRPCSASCPRCSHASLHSFWPPLRAQHLTRASWPRPYSASCRRCSHAVVRSCRLLFSTRHLTCAPPLVSAARAVHALRALLCSPAGGAVCDLLHAAVSAAPRRRVPRLWGCRLSCRSSVEGASLAGPLLRASSRQRFRPSRTLACVHA